MVTVLCTMAVVAFIATAACRPEPTKCTQGPGWRLQCQQFAPGDDVHPSGTEGRTDGVVLKSVRHPSSPPHPLGDYSGVAGVEPADSPAETAAPPAPSTTGGRDRVPAQPRPPVPGD